MSVSSTVEFLARSLAILGGIALCAIVAITVVSVAGRSLIPLGLAPIPGDFELVEAMTAFAIFAFLPWCHLKRGHVSVDILTRFIGNRSNRLIDAIGDSLMLAFSLIMSWRLYAGMVDKKAYGETTFILQFPIWWSYALGMIGAAGLVIVSAYCFQRSWVRFLTDRDGTPKTQRGAGVEQP